MTISTSKDMSRVATLLQAAVIELTLKGYSLEQAQAAVKRARGWAGRLAQKVRPELQEAVFDDLFKSQMETADDWLDRFKSRMTNEDE